MENLSVDSLKNVLNGLEPEAKNAFDFLVSKNAPEKEQACALRSVEHLLLLDPDLPSIIATIVFQIPQIDQEDLADIKTHFGQEVGGLVKDLMKFSRIKFQINTSDKRKTFIKRAVMILSKNNRSLYAKLATRLAKLEVRKSMTNATIEELARETLDVHAPLAELLGLWTLHQQLEDKAFEILQFQEYQKIALYKNNKLALNDDHINRIKQTLENVAKTAGITHVIEIKEKNL